MARLSTKITSQTTESVSSSNGPSNGAPKTYAQFVANSAATSPERQGFLERTFEKFPSILTPRGKSRSLTEAEIQAGQMSPEQVKDVADHLKSESPPMSLQEARERRQSMKEDRKRSVEFIRGRTTSRAAAAGLPVLDERK